MNDTFPWLILFITSITLALGVALLLRTRKSVQDAGREVHDELRTGREEARTAAKELREEVSGSLRATGDTLSKS
jgi:hypothetical protein